MRALAAAFFAACCTLMFASPDDMCAAIQMTMRAIESARPADGESLRRLAEMLRDCQD